MLVLSRKKGEKIVIGDNIVVTVLEVSGGNVRLGIDAPKEVKIYRQETYGAMHGKEDKSQDENSPAMS